MPIAYNRYYRSDEFSAILHELVRQYPQRLSMVFREPVGVGAGHEVRLVRAAAEIVTGAADHDDLDLVVHTCATQQIRVAQPSR